MSKPRYVYFIKPVGMDGPIKIGCSDMPSKRLEDFLTWCPFQLELIGKTTGGLAEEQFLHRCFSDSHSHHEWFHFTPALRETIQRILASSIADVRDGLTPKQSIRKPRGKKAPKTDSQKLEKTYANRVNSAESNLRKVAGELGIWRQPADVRKIMSEWHGVPYKKIDGIHPTVAQISRLEEYLSDPGSHAVFSGLHRQRQPICIPVFLADEAAA